MWNFEVVRLFIIIIKKKKKKESYPHPKSSDFETKMENVPPAGLVQVEEEKEGKGESVEQTSTRDSSVSKRTNMEGRLNRTHTPLFFFFSLRAH